MALNHFATFGSRFSVGTMEPPRYDDKSKNYFTGELWHAVEKHSAKKLSPVSSGDSFFYTTSDEEDPNADLLSIKKADAYGISDKIIRILEENGFDKINNRQFDEHILYQNNLKELFEMLSRKSTHVDVNDTFSNWQKVEFADIEKLEQEFIIKFCEVTRQAMLGLESEKPSILNMLIDRLEVENPIAPVVTKTRHLFDRIIQVTEKLLPSNIASGIKNRIDAVFA